MLPKNFRGGVACFFILYCHNQTACMASISSDVDALSVSLINLNLTDQVNCLKTVFSNGRKIHLLDVMVSRTQLIPLSLFEYFNDYCSLQINTEGSDSTKIDIRGISRFGSPLNCSHISSLTIVGAFLNSDVVDSIATLPALTELNLENSTCCRYQYLEPLEKCTQLRKLVLDGLRFEGEHDNVLSGQVLLLKRKLVQTEILPKIAAVDHTDYQEVLVSSDGGTEFTYSIQSAIESAKNPSLSTLQELLNQDSECTNWVSGWRYQYKHNRCTKALCVDASPIKCPDGRERIATQEPENEFDCRYFWRAVLDFDVTVIVMVKEINSAKQSYFPQKPGETRTFVEQNNQTIHITCIDYQEVRAGMFLRRLKVGEKEICHLQINWIDGQGIDVEKLGPFLRDVEHEEQKQPKGTTIVHCWAGIGRTGTTFACMILHQLMANKPVDRTLKLHLKNLLTGLRQQREGMIQTSSQLCTVLQYFARLIS